MLDPQKTYIFYDGICIPREKREDAFRSIPQFIKRCDFMIILAPGCTHFDKIDPRTGRKMNLCVCSNVSSPSARCVFGSHRLNVQLVPYYERSVESKRKLRSMIKMRALLVRQFAEAHHNYRDAKSDERWSIPCDKPIAGESRATHRKQDHLSVQCLRVDMVTLEATRSS